MKQIKNKTYVLDGSVTFERDCEVRGNTFILKRICYLEDLELDTFKKRIKWLVTGKI